MVNCLERETISCDFGGGKICINLAHPARVAGQHSREEMHTGTVTDTRHCRKGGVTHPENN